jgi:hypothetical protein
MIRYYFKVTIKASLEQGKDNYEIIEHDYVNEDVEDSLNIASNIKHESFIFNNSIYICRDNSVIEWGALKSNTLLKEALDIYILNNRIKKLNKI